MKPFVLILFVASCAAVIAQAPAKPATAAKSVPAARPALVASGVKLPPGVPAVRGIVKSAFTLRYQDAKIGAGALVEPNKMYIVHYTGWLAADGHKFDSSFDHPASPVLDKDGKPVMGDDGKPKQAPAQPIRFPQGMGRVIPGFDQGFDGMKIGGKRRLFIPWQLAYGAHGRPGPDPAHPVIPAKADLIFDIELVDVAEMPTPPNRPGMMPVRPGMTLPQGHAPATPGNPAAPAAPGATAAPATPTAPSTPSTTAAPAAPTAPATPPTAPVAPPTKPPTN